MTAQLCSCRSSGKSLEVGFGWLEKCFFFFYWSGHSWLPLPLLLFIVSPKFWGFGCSSRFGWVRSRLVWLCGLTGSAVSAAWARAAHQVTETSAPSSERSKTMTEYPATMRPGGGKRPLRTLYCHVCFGIHQRFIVWKTQTSHCYLLWDPFALHYPELALQNST